VLENRYRQSEFAADLAAVDLGKASGDYASPKDFFNITFLTEGLRRVLTTALERLTGRGGEPVLGLQTNFGGGKTHTMLALYHLARSADLSTLTSPSLPPVSVSGSGNRRKLPCSSARPRVSIPP
jgi:predicted AAA+ superfamily ATPase